MVPIESSRDWKRRLKSFSMLITIHPPLCLFSIICLIAVPFLRYFNECRLYQRMYYLVKSTVLSFLLLVWNYMNYRTTVIGDDISVCYEEPTLVISNHRSLLDGIVIEALAEDQQVASITSKNSLSWVLEYCGHFIKNEEEDTIAALKQYLIENSTFPQFDWMVMFLENGLFKNQKAKSDKYAKEHSLPIFRHVATPRVKGFQTVIKTLRNKSPPYKHSGKKLSWILNLTLLLERDDNKLEIVMNNGIIGGATIVCQLYHINELPQDDAGLSHWLMDRFQEKDIMLDKYKTTGEIPGFDLFKRSFRCQSLRPKGFLFYLSYSLYLTFLCNCVILPLLYKYIIYTL